MVAFHLERDARARDESLFLVLCGNGNHDLVGVVG